MECIWNVLTPLCQFIHVTNTIYYKILIKENMNGEVQYIAKTN